MREIVVMERFEMELGSYDRFFSVLRENLDDLVKLLGILLQQLTEDVIDDLRCGRPEGFEN